MPYKDKTSPEAKASNARRNKKYYEKNKEKIIEYKSQEKFKEYRRNWYLKNAEKHKKHTVNQRRIKMFGVDDKMYKEMLVKQNNKCLICGVDKSELKYTLCVDHNHDTGEVRGLLCHDCNVGIGRMKDNIETLKNAIKYLTNK